MKRLLLAATLFASTFSSASAQQECHASYEGACVPIASDVDGAGGSGNGPACVRGPVYVVGPDVYDLDRDGDGVACE
jgi:resuscitation-promoting factor RpfB